MYTPDFFVLFHRPITFLCWCLLSSLSCVMLISAFTTAEFSVFLTGGGWRIIATISWWFLRVAISKAAKTEKKPPSYHYVICIIISSLKSFLLLLYEIYCSFFYEIYMAITVHICNLFVTSKQWNHEFFNSLI